MNRYFMCENTVLEDITFKQFPAWVAGKKVGDVVTGYVPTNARKVISENLDDRVIDVYDRYSIAHLANAGIDWQLVILEQQGEEIKVFSLVK
jgi:hypothetical protein